MKGIDLGRSLQYRVETAHYSIRKMIWRFLYHRADRSVPVFLIGCGRSGTNMVVRHLEKSGQVKLYNEDHPSAFEKWRIRGLDVIEQLINRCTAPFIIFKPILDTHQTNVFLSHFPNAKIVFMFRHYDDVINSSIRRFGSDNRLNHVRCWIENDFSEFASAPLPIETKEFIRSRWNPSLTPEIGAALFWLFSNRLFFDLGLAQDERVLLICYESLVSNPRKEFKLLAKFLGLTFKEQIIKGIFASSIQRNPPPKIGTQIRADCEELWQSLNQYVLKSQRN